MYTVLIEKHAEKDLESLPKDICQRIIRELISLKNKPRPHNCRKLTGSKNDWRIRIGTYRVLYEIDDHSRIVRIYRIKHRKEAYL